MATKFKETPGYYITSISEEEKAQFLSSSNALDGNKNPKGASEKVSSKKGLKKIISNVNNFNVNVFEGAKQAIQKQRLNREFIELKISLRGPKLQTLIDDFEKGADLKSVNSLKDLKTKFIEYTTEKKDISDLSDKEKYNLAELVSDSELGINEKIVATNIILATKKNDYIRYLIGKKFTLNKRGLFNQLRTCFVTYDIMNATGYKWNDSTILYLARRAGIPNYSGQNTKNVEDLRDWFLNKMLDINSKQEEIKKFLRPELQNVLDNVEMAEGRLIEISEALDALTEEQKSTLNGLNKERFESFLLSLVNAGTFTGKKITDSFGLKEKTGRNLGIYLSLSSWDVTRELIDIPKEETVVTDEEIVAESKKLDIPITKGSPERDEVAVKLEEKKVIDRSKNLPPEKQQEVMSRINEHKQKTFVLAKKYNFESDLKVIRGTEQYQQIEQQYKTDQKITQKLVTLDIETKIPVDVKKSWEKFSGDLIKNEIFSQESYHLPSLPAGAESEDLAKFKPVPKEYAGKDGLLDKKLMDQQNIPEQEQQKLIATYATDNIKASVEQTLLDESNEVIKSQTIENVIQFLQATLNIQIDQLGKEYLIEQFKDIKNNIQGSLFTIEGQYQGQKVSFRYDLTTGELMGNDRLSKEIGQQSIQIDGKHFATKLSHGPNIQDMVTAAKNIGYQSIVKNSNGDIEAYRFQYKQELATKYPQQYPSSQDTEVLKKHYLKTILAQEMFDTLGLKDPNGPTTINAETYPIYKTLYNSIENYTVEELQQMRENMKTLSSLNNQIKEGNFSQQGNSNIASQILLQLFSLTETEKTKTTRLSAHFNDFFKGMESDQPRGQEQVKIIDPRKISYFIADVQNTKDDRAISYDSNKLQGLMSPYLADVYLEKELNTMPLA